MDGFELLKSRPNFYSHVLSTAKCNNQLLCSACVVYSTQYNYQKSEACGLFSIICDFKEDIGDALNTTKALLLHRPGEACGLLVNISANWSSVWFFSLGCYIRQSRVMKDCFYQPCSG